LRSGVLERSIVAIVRGVTETAFDGGLFGRQGVHPGTWVSSTARVDRVEVLRNAGHFKKNYSSVFAISASAVRIEWYAALCM